MRLLPGPWYRGGARGAPDLATMLEIALPQTAQDWQHLAQVSAALALVEAAGHSVELVLERAAAQPQFQPAVAVQINQGGFAGDADGMPVGRHHNCCAEADARGVRRPVHQEGERFRTGHQLDRVMFGGPGDLEAPFPRQPYEFAH